LIRKLNFTDRIKVPRSAVSIALRRDATGLLVFDPLLALTDIALPADARVFVEAFYRASYMRFDCGTVGRPAIPEMRRLTDIDSDNLVRFRVKVVGRSLSDEHRVLAASPDITIAAAGPGASGRISLLPVNFRDLGEQIWRVEIETNQAVLELNSRIASIEQMARTDMKFFALVYPAAVREILTHIVLVEQYGADEEADEWWSLWLRWAAALMPDPLPEDVDDRPAWISSVVAAFCARYELSRSFDALEPEA
jgi:hypothetical protein